MTRRPLRWPAALAAALLTVAVTGCGDDDSPAAPERSDEVGGRAPSTSGPEEQRAGTADDDGRDAEGPGGDSDGAAPGSDAPGPLTGVEVTLTTVVEVDQPTKLVGRPGSDLLYVAEQEGTVLALDPATGTTEVALDLTAVTRAGGEQGLLGLAFSPDGGTLFVHHSGTEGETRVARFAMEGDTADADSRTDLLTVDQPYPNHNGGDLVVDDEGMLWIGLGDGGAGGDPEDRAQDTDVLLGKLLRIDPGGGDASPPYGIPAGNPFAAGGGRPEIVVVGVRNPWRFRFDAATGDLWVADVGQERWEEITRVPAGSVAGANLGWPRFEGSEPYDEDRDLAPGDEPTGPVYEVSHDDGWCSISGGAVYRGTAIPDLEGAYLFGDYCRPGLAAIRLDDRGVPAETAVLDGDVGSVVSVDTDLDGEVWVLSHSGAVARLDPT